MITTILVGTLSLLVLVMASRVMFLERLLNKLEFRVFKAEETLRRHSTGDFGP